MAGAPSVVHVRRKARNYTIHKWLDSTNASTTEKYETSPDPSNSICDIGVIQVLFTHIFLIHHQVKKVRFTLFFM